MDKKDIWAIVPAAGVGKRMQSDIPKQYLPLNGRPVLEHTINTLLSNENVCGLVISIQQDDGYFSSIKIDSDKPVIRATGGKERADSVANALQALTDNVEDAENCWVLVHDAVRACLRHQDINRLIEEVADDENGGILALPVRDTMKRQQANSEDQCIELTVDRNNLWHALTPQYFPANLLKNALEASLNKSGKVDMVITDESSAMEAAGYRPRLVEGFEDNIKITRPEDLRLASLYLKSHKAESD